jgi:acetyltransferase-like isoleucine patch superfamily enzyme
MSFRIIDRLRNKIKVSKTSIINIDKNVKIVGCKIVIKGKNNQLIIGKNSRLHHIHIEMGGENSILVIGQNCMIGDNSYLSAKEGASLTIGNDCGLSRNVKIMTTDGHPIFQDGKRINYVKDIVLEPHVWIGDSVTILKGVTIGSGSVVGINSTVTKSVGINSIIAGNPATIIKENIRWEA